ncbi:MAG: acetylxylan esterase, partial [Bacteroidota bacterium]|nr:acetylxylan esterase [Bacteroidota bacterium]
MTFKKTTLLLACLAITLLQSMTALSQVPPDANMDEAKVKPYTLPDPLMMANGKKVTTAAQWQKVQRPYIYHLFEKNVYGRYPSTPVAIHFEVRETDHHALNGTATRKQVRIFLKPDDTSVFVDVLIYLPNSVKGPAPVFVGYNFMGNATVQQDQAIFLSDRLA